MVDTAKTFEIQINCEYCPAFGRQGRITRPAFALNDFFVNLRTVISIYTLHANNFFSSAPILWLTTASNSTTNVITFQGVNGGQQLCFNANI